jgi:uncharacterized protein (TIGR02996 family)
MNTSPTLTDSDALFEQVKACPEDETLLLAYSDCLEEEGRLERAQLVRQLAEMLSTERYRKLVPDSPQDHLLRDRIRWQLGLTKIEVGSLLATWSGYGMYPTTFDGAIWVADETVNGIVRMHCLEGGPKIGAYIVKQVE